MRELDFQLKADEKAPLASRARLSQMRDELGSLYPDVKLVVSELVTNSIRHSPDTDMVQVRVAETADRVRVEVVDEGPGFGEETPRGEGLGLVIVDQVAADWGVHVDGICTVWAELKRTPGGL